MNSKRWISGLSVAMLLAGTGYIATTAMADDKAKPDAKHEAKAEAKGVKVGDAAPDFTLTDTTGKSFTLSELTKKGDIVVLEWFNSECPFCKKHGEAGTMKKIVADYQGKNVVMLGINSGPDSKGKDAAAIKTWSLNYPILQDGNGKVGHLYGAKTTPHMFIVGKDGKIAYMGAIDDQKDGGKNYVRQALDQIIKGETVTEPSTKSYGCSVKYAG